VSGVALSGDGGLVVAGAGNKIISINTIEKKVLDELLVQGSIKAISLSEDYKSTLVATNESINLYRNNDLLWRRSADDITSTLIGPNGDYFGYATGTKLLLYKIKTEVIIEPPKRRFAESKSIYLAITGVVVVLLGLGLLFRKRRAGAQVELAPETSLEKKFTVKVVNQAGASVVNASVKMGNIEKRTDANGEAAYKGISGEHIILIEKPLYDVRSEVYVAKEGKETIEISIPSSIHLNDKQLDKIGQIRGVLARSLGEVSSFDDCLPNYYTGVAERFIKFIEAVTDNPEFFVNNENNYSRIIDDFIDILFQICEDISNIMVDWKNVQIYRASMGLKTGKSEPVELETGFYDSFVELNLNPEAYLNHATQLVKDTSANLDKKITEKMGELTILPVTGLWKISNELVEKSASTKGYKSAIRVILAIEILKYAEKMFENPSIVERLKRTIV